MQLTKKQYNYSLNIYSKPTQFQDGVQVIEEGLEEIANPITPEYAEQIVKAFIEGRPFYGKSLYELNPSMAIAGITNIPPSYDYNIFPISIKNTGGKAYYQDEDHFGANFCITIPAKVGESNPSLGIIQNKMDLYLELRKASKGHLFCRAARYKRNVSVDIREENSPQVNGLLDLQKMMSFPDLLTLNKGDQLDVDFSAYFLSAGFEYPGINIGDSFYESYGYIYSSDFKMVHYDDTLKKFIYVPVSTNITLSDDKQSFQKIVCDFELDNKKYHMVFDYQQDNGLILTEKYSYDNNQTPFILDLDKYVNVGTKEEAEYQYIIAALHDIYMDESIYNKSSRPPMVASAFLEQMPSKGHLIYKLQDALDIYNAVMQHRPMFGKMGYGKNPADPSLVKYPDIFPLYYDVYQDSKFNYTDENNFDLEFQLFINHPIGGQNPSLGYNKWGCMPFSLRFICNNGQFIYYLGIGTENPVIYENMLSIPKLNALLGNYGIVPSNITNIAVGDQIGIEIPNNKIDNLSYGIWIEGCVQTVSTLFPYPTEIEYDESHKVTGFTMTYQYQINTVILKYVISETQSDPDNKTYFTLQSRDIYSISPGKRLYLGQILVEGDFTSNFSPGTPAYNTKNVKELFSYIQSASEQDDINAIYTKMDSVDAQLGYFIAYNGSYRVTFFVDRQNSFYANAGESGFYIYIPGDLDNVIAVLKADEESGALPLAEVSLIQRGSTNGGRVKLNVDNIEKFGEEAVNSNITNPSNILYYAVQDAIIANETSANVSYKESSLLKDICDYVINNDIRRGYFYTNIALGGGSGSEYQTQFFVDYDVIYTSNESGDLYNKVVKIYSPFNEGKNPSLAVYINEYGIVNIETNNLGFGEYLLNFDPSKNDGEYNAFQINYSSLYDKSRFTFTYNDGDDTGNVDQKIYYLHFNNISTFAKNDVIFSLYNDTNKSIEVRISEVTISMAPYEEITFQYLTMGPDRLIHRLYVSNVNPMS